MCRKFTLEYCQELAEKNEGKCLSDIYIDVKTNMTWLCKNNHILTMTTDAVNQGSWCKECYFQSIKNIGLEKCKAAAQERNGKCLSIEFPGTRGDIEWECDKGHKFKKRLDVVLLGSWCKECYVPASKNKALARCINIAKEKNGKCLSEIYPGENKKVKWECERGHKFEKTIKVVCDGAWCRECINEDFLNKYKGIAKNKGGVCLSTEYINSSTRLELRCSNGHNWFSLPGNIEKHWCSSCAGLDPLTLEQCQEIAESRGGKCLSTEYINNQTKLEWQCGKCDYIWPASPSSIKNNGSWCLPCSGRLKLTLEECQKIAKDRGGLCLSTEYTNNQEKLEWQCEKGHKWNAAMANIKYGETWCPECKLGKTQQKLYDIIKKLLNPPEIKQNYTGFKWLKNKKRLEVDIWLPNIKLAIEYDGRQHFETIIEWGGKKALKQTQKLDKLKNKLIAQHPEEIRHFIRIPYTEEITETNIKNILTKNGIQC